MSGIRRDDAILDDFYPVDIHVGTYIVISRPRVGAP
jgi:hypothetical protein